MLKNYHARYFTKIEFDKQQRVVKKSLRNSANLEHRNNFLEEIEYYRNIPPHLARYFPHIIELNSEGLNPYIIMSWCDGINASNAFLDDRISVDDFIELCATVSSVLNEFSQTTGTPKDASLYKIYREKTLNRLRVAQQDWATSDDIYSQNMSRICSDEFTLNGLRHMSLVSLADRCSTELIKSIGSAGKLGHRFMHGDLVFTNIIYCQERKELCLIDPRGSFGGAPTNFGDHLYDLGKLAQSYIGLYDLIISENSEIEIREDEFMFRVNQTRIQECKSICASEILSGDSLKVLFVVVLLLISLLPLHSNDRKQQLAFALRASELFQNANSK
jgi:hypothetical protein